MSTAVPGPQRPALSFRDVLGVFGAKIVTLPLTLVVGIVVTRILGPTDRGQLVFLNLLGSLVLPVCTLGLGASAIYLIGSQRFAVREVALTVLASGMAIGAIMAAALYALWRMNLLGEAVRATTPGLVLATLSCLPLQGATLMAGRLILGSSWFALSNAIAVGQPIVAAATLFALVPLGRLGLTGAVAAAVCTNILSLIVHVGAVWARFRPLWRVRLDYMRYALGYGLRAWPGDLALRSNLRLDQLILGMYAEPRALGIYSVAVTVSELIWIVPDSLGVVLFNRLAREQHMDVARKLVARVHRILFGTMAALAIALGASSGWLIQHLYGQAFANAVVPLLWLLPGTVAMTTTKVLTKYLSANGMPGRSSLLQVGGMAVSVGWYLLLIPALGTVGAAIASLIGYVGTAFASVVLYRRGLRHDRGGLFSFSREDFEWVGHQLRSALHL